MLRKTIFLVFLSVFLCGCAGYKFQKGQPPYNKGYVASREGYTIVEYTLGKDDTVAEKVSLAKERFKRRRRTVEHYYKRMGAIENRFKEALVDYPVMILKLALGVFKMPGIAIHDYRYEHSLKYKERMDRLEDEKDAREQERINRLKGALNEYIRRDLEKKEGVVYAKQEADEEQITGPAAEKTQEAAAEKITQQPAASEEKQPEEKLAPPELEKAAEEPVVVKVVETSRVISSELDKISTVSAVITARPGKGFSPLTVHFSAGRSFSKSGKIISYSWDFGDGDSSSRANPVNTYYSGSFEPKEFIATLTVQDDKGNTASTTKSIQVLNK